VGWQRNTTWHSLRMIYKQCKLGWCRSVMKATLLLRPKQFFVRIYPRIVVGRLKDATWHFLRLRYKQCKLGWSGSVMKGTLLLMPTQFFVLFPLAL
jgi:hypothetical protein